jgi:hypothetical protein
MTSHHPDGLLLVREQLYLLAHDDAQSMRPHVHVPAIGVGLAAAALIDLLIDQHVHIINGTAYVIPRRGQAPELDPITEYVLRIIGNLRHSPGLHLLLRDLGPTLYTQTGEALITRGILTAGRRWGRTRRELARLRSSSWIRQSLRYRITGRDQPDLPIDALCALTWALGLDGALLMELSRTEIDELLRGVMNRIPELLPRPDLPAAAIPQVADAVRTAVAGLATSPY